MKTSIMHLCIDVIKESRGVEMVHFTGLKVAAMTEAAELIGTLPSTCKTRTVETKNIYEIKTFSLRTDLPFSLSLSIMFSMESHDISRRLTQLPRATDHQE